MTVSRTDQLIALLEPLAEAHGLELVTVELAGGQRHKTVQVFLDRDGGIDIEAIAASNEWISEALDAAPGFDGPYTLEVSSPGIERVLRTRRDFERFCGERITVHTTRPIDGRSHITGQLVRFESDDAFVEADGHEHRVPFDAIERARLKADFGDVGERGGKPS